MKEKQKYKKMNQIIKSRIEEINRGKIPEGYKKTSVGIVPIEWTEHTLGDIFKFKNGINKEKEAFGQGTPIVNYTDVWKKRGLKSEDIKGRVVLSKNEIQNYEVKCGDVFFTRTSETIEEIGYSSVLLDDIENAIFSGFVLRARPYNNLVSREYHQYCYSEPQMRHEIIKRSSMTTRALTSGPMLSQVAINLPSHREQSKIAEILMKWDETIELYNQQIEKLKQLKSICLKKMFPKKGERVPEWRFKGFSDAWEQRKFEDLYNYASEGGTPDTNNSFFYKNGDVPFVKIEDTESKYIDSTKSYITQEGLSHSSAWLIPENSVIFTNGATVGNVAINLLPVATKQGILGVIPSKKVVTEFLFYLLSSATFQREVRSRMATGTFATIILKNLNQIPVCIPSDKSEQEEIAGYLSAFDNLITLHQRKVEKIKAQQKVLQKYLLNGIVRV